MIDELVLCGLDRSQPPVVGVSQREEKWSLPVSL